MMIDFYKKPGNSVKTKSTSKLGRNHKSMSTFVMTIKSLKEIQLSGFLPAPEIIQNIGDGPSER